MELERHSQNENLELFFNHSLVSQKIKCSSDHNQGADIVFEIGDKTYAIEYERGTRSQDDLIKKRDRLLAYDDYRFVCSPIILNTYQK